MENIYLFSYYEIHFTFARLGKLSRKIARNIKYILLKHIFFLTFVRKRYGSGNDIRKPETTKRSVDDMSFVKTILAKNGFSKTVFEFENQHKSDRSYNLKVC